MKNFFVSVILLGGWEALVKLTKIPIYILPPPSSIFVSLISNFHLITTHAFITLSETLIGLFIAVIIGIVSALILDHFKRLQQFLAPLLLTLQSVPTFILMPILLVWFGFGFFPKLVVISLSCYFPITLCLLDGLKRSSTQWLEMATLMQATSRAKLWFIRFPAALPSLMSGIKLTAIHGPLTVLAADWIGANSGLGYLIMLSHGRLQIDLTFSCVFCVVFMVFCFNKLIQVIEKKVIFWPPIN